MLLDFVLLAYSFGQFLRGIGAQERTQPALRALAVNDWLRAAHQRPVSLSQMPQRSLHAVSIALAMWPGSVSVAFMALPARDIIGLEAA